MTDERGIYAKWPSAYHLAGGAFEGHSWSKIEHFKRLCKEADSCIKRSRHQLRVNVYRRSQSLICCGILLVFSFHKFQVWCQDNHTRGAWDYEDSGKKFPGFDISRRRGTVVPQEYRGPHTNLSNILKGGWKTNQGNPKYTKERRT